MLMPVVLNKQWLIQDTGPFLNMWLAFCCCTKGMFHLYSVSRLHKRMSVCQCILEGGCAAGGEGSVSDLDVPPSGSLSDLERHVLALRSDQEELYDFAKELYGTPIISLAPTLGDPGKPSPPCEVEKASENSPLEAVPPPVAPELPAPGEEPPASPERTPSDRVRKILQANKDKKEACADSLRAALIALGPPGSKSKDEMAAELLSLHAQLHEAFPPPSPPRDASKEAMSPVRVPSVPSVPAPTRRELHGLTLRVAPVERAPVAPEPSQLVLHTASGELVTPEDFQKIPNGPEDSQVPAAVVNEGQDPQVPQDPQLGITEQSSSAEVATRRNNVMKQLEELRHTWV